MFQTIQRKLFFLRFKMYPATCKQKEIFTFVVSGSSKNFLFDYFIFDQNVLPIDVKSLNSRTKYPVLFYLKDSHNLLRKNNSVSELQK